MTKERCPKCGSVKQEGTGFYDCGTAQSGNSIPCEQSKLCYTRQQARQELLAEVIGKLEVMPNKQFGGDGDVIWAENEFYTPTDNIWSLISELKTLQGG